MLRDRFDSRREATSDCMKRRLRRLFLFRDTHDHDNLGTCFSLQTVHSNIHPVQASCLVRSDDGLRGWLSIKQCKGLLTQLWSLPCGYLREEVGRMEYGIHHRTLDHSVSAGHVARSGGFLFWKGEPSFRLRSHVN